MVLDHPEYLDKQGDVHLAYVVCEIREVAVSEDVDYVFGQDQ